MKHFPALKALVPLLLTGAALLVAFPSAAQDVSAQQARKARLEKEMAGPELTVTVDLHLGDYSSSIYTCDFSLDYVHINADYTT